MDFVTRCMEAVPLWKVDARTTCNALLEIFARYGILKEILSDNGSNFTASVTEALLKILKVYHIKSGPFHPATNGMLKRSHQVLQKTLDELGATTKDWDDFLPQTLMALRTAPHAALGFSPFHLLFGKEARTPVKALRESWEEMQNVNMALLGPGLWTRLSATTEIVAPESPSICLTGMSPIIPETVIALSGTSEGNLFCSAHTRHTHSISCYPHFSQPLYQSGC